MASDFNCYWGNHKQKMRQSSTNFCEIKLMNFWRNKIDKTKKKNGQNDVCLGMLFSSDYASMLLQKHNDCDYYRELLILAPTGLWIVGTWSLLCDGGHFGPWDRAVIMTRQCARPERIQVESELTLRVSLTQVNILVWRLDNIIETVTQRIEYH